jgi:DNA polymerase-3 subunit delta'
LQFDNLSHPNFELVYSIPAGKAGESDSPFDKMDNEQLSEIRRELALKAENNYHKIEIKGANYIRVSFIRYIKKKLLLSNSVPGRRFILVSRADEMNTESANAFLKTLEEPNEGVTIVLTSSKPESLLPTITSRCRKVQFAPVEHVTLTEALVNDFGYEYEEARVASLFSGGSPVRALQFSNSGLLESRNAMINALRVSLKKQEFQTSLAAAIEEISSAKDKARLINSLKLLQMWLRDVAAKRADAENLIINSDDLETINKFVKAFAHRDIYRAIEIIDEAIAQVGRNVNSALILFRMFFKLREIFLV